MNTGVFVFQNANNMELSPAEYGFASMQWSDKNAHQTLDSIQSSELDGCSTYMQSFAVYLQLLSLNAAAYWFYAINVLHMPAQHISQMKQGMADSLAGFHDPNGAPFQNHLIDYVNASFRKYFDSILDDQTNNIDYDPNAINPDICQTSSAFISEVESILSRNNQTMEEPTKLYVGHLVADLPISIFSSFNEQGAMFNA